MPTEVLGLGVDSRGVRKGTDDLRALGQEAKKAENAAESSAKRYDQLSKDIGKAFTGVFSAVQAAAAVYINYADALDEMSMRTGIAANDLAALEFAALQSGTSLQKLEQMLGRVSDKATDAASGNRAAAAVFKAMGLDVTGANGALKSQEELLLGIAEKFSTYRDGTTKAALAQDLFGRGGRELIPLLNKGASGIEELKQKYRELGGLTVDSAARLNEFNDRLAATEARAKVLTGQFVEGLLPALSQAVSYLEGASVSADKFKSAGTLLGQVTAFLADMGMRASGALQALGTALGASAAAAAMVARGEFKNALQTMKDMSAEIDQLEAEMERKIATANALRKQAEAGLVGSAIMDQNDRALTRGGSAAPTVARDVQKANSALKEFTGTLRELEQKAAVIQEELARAFDAAPITEAEKALTRLMATDKWDRYTNAQKGALVVMYAHLAALERQKKAREEERKSIEEVAKVQEADARASAGYAAQRAKEYEEWLGQQEAARRGVEELVQSLEDEAKTLGMTTEERERYNETMKVTRLYQQGLISTEEEYLTALERVNNALDDRNAARRRKESLENSRKEIENSWRETMEAVDGFAQSAFNSIFDSGANAFVKLAEMAKSTLLAVLYQMTVRPFIVQLVASVTGGTAGGSSVVGGAGSILNLFSGTGGGIGGVGGSLLGGLGGAITGLGGNFFGGIGGALGNIATEGLLAGTIGNFSAGFGALGAGNLLGGIGTLIGGALPVIGIALALAAAFGAFSRKGGPKTGGFAQSSGLNLERFFTPNQEDATAQGAVDDMLASYNQALARLGGTGTGAFAAGFDTDPQGTANNRAVIEAYVNNVLAYRYASGDDALGRDAEQLQETIALESKRAILAALQASELPEEIAAILNSVTAATASAEDVDRVVAFAAAFRDLTEYLAGVDLASDVSEALARANETSVDALGRMASELRSLGAEFDGSTDSLQALGSATVEYRQVLVQLLAQIEQLRESIHGTLENTREDIRTSLMSDEELYGYYSGRAQDLRQQLATASSPEQVASLVSQINDYIQRAYELSGNFEMADEQRRALQEEQIRLLNELEQEANSRLSDISETIRDAGEQTLADMRTLLTDFVNQLTAGTADIKTAATLGSDAAATQLTAANINLQAARTPLRIELEPGAANA